MRAGAMRHRVNVMRPTKNAGDLGEQQGQPETYIANWRCSIKTISGSESESAHRNAASASLIVEGYGDPGRPITEECFLQFGSRTLNIAGIIDESQHQIGSIQLLCGETK